METKVMNNGSTYTGIKSKVVKYLIVCTNHEKNHKNLRFPLLQKVSRKYGGNFLDHKRDCNGIRGGEFMQDRKEDGALDLVGLCGSGSILYKNINSLKGIKKWYIQSIEIELKKAGEFEEDDCISRVFKESCLGDTMGVLNTLLDLSFKGEDKVVHVHSKEEDELKDDKMEDDKLEDNELDDDKLNEDKLKDDELKDKNLGDDKLEDDELEDNKL